MTQLYIDSIFLIFQLANYPITKSASSSLFRSVKLLGWSTIVVSVIVICSELFGLVLAQSLDQFSRMLNAFPQFKTGPMSDLLDYNRIWSIYSIFYFMATLVGAAMFVGYRETGRRILEVAAWVGILNACIDSIMSYTYWRAMESSLSGLTGMAGMPIAQLNPIGLGAIILGFFLWVIPSVGFIVYLRRPSLRALMKSSSPSTPLSPTSGVKS